MRWNFRRKYLISVGYKLRHFRKLINLDMIFFSKTGCVLGPSDKIFTQNSARIRERAGLPKNFRMVHGLRHVFGTLHAEAGTPTVLSTTIHPDIKRTIVLMSKRTGMTVSQVADEVLYTGLIEMQELDAKG